MLCQKCGSVRSRVIDSRPSEDGTRVRRRRVCEDCGSRFTTYETYRSQPLIVKKKDRSSEQFDRDKLLRGLMTATVKRDVAVSDLENLIDTVETELRTQSKSLIESHDLGEMVLERLRDIDDVAYIRFASVYRDFKDIDEFQSVLKGM
ncbi:MAG: transcriptional regulator NrdR [Coriobacteriales bacterium]|jgi:transcriptional repressor NrdR|nr:transcriptional regulator NrdR [Coriobacteriales bacterium]